MPEEFAREIGGAKGCGKDGGLATVEDASRFSLSGLVVRSAMIDDVDRRTAS